MGKSTEAKERRLVPEVIEDFFIHAGPIAGVQPKEVRAESHIYRIGRVPRTLWPIGEKLEPRFGKLGREYKQVVFDKNLLVKDVTSEWVTPGHPLFEAVREDLLGQARDDMQRGAVFFDLNASTPYRLDIFTASIRDGRGNSLHRRLFLVQVEVDGSTSVKQPTLILDLAFAPKGTPAPEVSGLPERDSTEQVLIEKALQPFLAEAAAERKRETETILRHIEISLNELINRQQVRFGELMEQQQQGDTSPLIAANLKQVEDRLYELNGRLEGRRDELEQERQAMIGDIQFVGRAWALPHPERDKPEIASMVRDDEIERAAVDFVIQHETRRGWVVESVEAENRGFDLISRRFDSNNPMTCVEIRFIEVKGRAMVGEIALTTYEYKTAERLKNDYWLYVVFNCGSKPELHKIEDPARLGWKPIVKIEHYHVGAQAILRASNSV